MQSTVLLASFSSQLFLLILLPQETESHKAYVREAQCSTQLLLSLEFSSDPFVKLRDWHAICLALRGQQLISVSDAARSPVPKGKKLLPKDHFYGKTAHARASRVQIAEQELGRNPAVPLLHPGSKKNYGGTTGFEENLELWWLMQLAGYLDHQFQSSALRFLKHSCVHFLPSLWRTQILSYSHRVDTYPHSRQNKAQDW